MYCNREIKDDISKNVNQAFEESQVDKQLKFDYAKMIKADDKDVTIVYVPVKSLKLFQKEEDLTTKLEGKLNTPVFIVGTRSIVHRSPKSYRPYCKCSAAVKQAIFEDLVSPSYMVGKRILYAAGAEKQITQFYISDKSKSQLENKLQLISSVYEQLTKVHNTVQFK